MRTTRRALAVLATLIAVATPAVAAEELAIDSSDGFVLRATYRAGAEGGRGVLLLHQCNRDRESWDALASALSVRGLHTLALDFRGFGDSVGGSVTDFGTQRAELWPSFPADVDAAVDALRARPGVRAGGIGVIGASCGGSQELLLAMRDPQVAALVFLSSSLPAIDDTVRDEFLAQRDMPILAIAAEADRSSAEAAQALFAGSRNSASRLIVYKGDAHGVPLFEQDPHLIPLIVDWLVGQL